MQIPCWIPPSYSKGLKRTGLRFSWTEDQAEGERLLDPNAHSSALPDGQPSSDLWAGDFFPREVGARTQGGCTCILGAGLEIRSEEAIHKEKRRHKQPNNSELVLEFQWKSKSLWPSSNEIARASESVPMPQGQSEEIPRLPVKKLQVSSGEEDKTEIILFGPCKPPPDRAIWLCDECSLLCIKKNKRSPWYSYCGFKRMSETGESGRLVAWDFIERRIDTA